MARLQIALACAAGFLIASGASAMLGMSPAPTLILAGVAVCVASFPGKA